MVLTFAACGDSKPELTGDERVTLANWNLSVALYCMDGEPDDDYSGILEGTPKAISIFRSKPDAEFGTEGETRTVRQILSDNASMLEQCGVREKASELDRALNAGP